MVSENTPKIMSIGPPITEKQPFTKFKILLFLASFISKTKIVNIFSFPSVKYFGCLLFLNISHISLNYCWYYRPSNLLFRFTWSSWKQLNNRQRKTAVNLLINFLKDTVNSSVWWKFRIFDPRTLKWPSFEIFAKFNGKDIFLEVCQVSGISKKRLKWNR